MKRIWLPGWQFNALAFAPLFHALNVQAEQVLSYDNVQIDYSSWLETEIANFSDDIELVGWSLGGMLACEMAKRSSNVKRVRVMNSNVKFCGGPGLEQPVAEGFMARYERNPEATRKKFAHLVDTVNAEAVSPYLVPGNQLNTLKWLYDIELQNQTIPCPVHVLLANQDQLVPEVTARKAWANQAASITTLTGEHSLPLLNATDVAQWIVQHG